MTESAHEIMARAVAAAEADPHGGKVMVPLDVARTALSALVEERPVAVKVKALKWEQNRSDWEMFKAATIAGSYDIMKILDKWELTRNTMGELGKFDTVDAAKAAAQSDYETRIRSALVGVPAVESEPVSDPEPIAWYMHLWNEADEDIKSDVRWGRPTGDEIARAEHNGHDIEHLYAHPPRFSLIQSEEGEPWRGMDTAPTDGTEFIAAERWERTGKVRVRVYKYDGHPNYWHCREDGVCIRPEYQSRYVWTPVPAALSTRKGSAGDDTKGSSE